MSFNLRPRQQKCVDEVRSLVRQGKKSILIVGPPGVGKGSLISFFAASSAKNGNAVLQYVHKRELVFNLADRLKEQFGIESSIILPKFKPDKKKLIQIGSVQTLVRRDLDWLKLFIKIVIGDESHRMLTPTQMRLFDEFVCEVNGLGLIGLWFTATPFRPKSDKKKFSDYCDAIVQFTTYRQEMQDRFLVPTRPICPAGAASMDGVKLKMSFGEKDYDQDEMGKRYSEERIIKALYNRWREYTGGKQQTCCFNVNKSHNKAVYEYFKSRGVECAYIDEDTSTEERDAIMKRFKAGPFVENPLMFLANIAILSEGVDNQWIKCIILNYKSLSLTKYIQSAARGSRPCWNADQTDWLRLENGKYYKEDILILDIGGNTVMHGFLEDYDALPFDLSGEKPKGEAPTKECFECHRIVYASLRECPNCGYVFPVVIKKDKKKFLDEVEMEEMDNVKSIQNMVAKMTPKQIWEADTAWLRVIALCKGHPPLWPSVILEKRNEIPWFDKSKESQKYLFQYLEEKEIEKGTHKTYLELRERRVYK